MSQSSPSTQSGGHGTALHHPGQQPAHRLAGGDEAHLAVGARVHERGHEGAQLQDRPVALHVLAVDGVGDHRLQAGPEHGRLDGHVDELRLARQQPALVGDQRADGALGGGVVPRLGHGDAQRSPVGVAVERHRPAHRRQRQVGRQVVGVGTRLPERRDRHVDEIGTDGAHRLEAEAEPVQHTGPGVLDHEVGRRHEAQEVRPSRLVVEVEHDAALAAVVGVEPQAGQAVRLPGGELALASRRRTPRRLDLHDVGAEPGEHERRQLGTPVGQVEHPVGRQHRGSHAEHVSRPAPPRWTRELRF